VKLPPFEGFQGLLKPSERKRAPQGKVAFGRAEAKPPHTKPFPKRGKRNRVINLDRPLLKWEKKIIFDIIYNDIYVKEKGREEKRF
jgi:hypothetical protein